MGKNNKYERKRMELYKEHLKRLEERDNGRMGFFMKENHRLKEEIKELKKELKELKDDNQSCARKV